MKRIITFGEIMMRLNPEGYLRFVQADKFEATYAGGEANVAVSLANYGMDAAFVTKLPAMRSASAPSTSCAASAWIPAPSSGAESVWVCTSWKRVRLREPPR